MQYLQNISHFEIDWCLVDSWTVIFHSLINSLRNVIYCPFAPDQQLAVHDPNMKGVIVGLLFHMSFERYIIHLLLNYLNIYLVLLKIYAITWLFVKDHVIQDHLIHFSHFWVSILLWKTYVSSFIISFLGEKNREGDWIWGEDPQVQSKKQDIGT